MASGNQIASEKSKKGISEKLKIYLKKGTFVDESDYSHYQAANTTSQKATAVAKPSAELGQARQNDHHRRNFYKSGNETGNVSVSAQVLGVKGEPIVNHGHDQPGIEHVQGSFPHFRSFD